MPFRVQAWKVPVSTVVYLYPITQYSIVIKNSMYNFKLIDVSQLKYV